MKRDSFFSWLAPSLLIALASVLHPLCSLHGAIPVTAGLVAYYPFDGNAQDASGSANHGVVYNAAFDPSGIRVSQCLRCDGTDATYVQVPRSASLEPQDAMSISLWVKGAHGEQFGTLLRKANNMQSGYFIRRWTPDYADQRPRFETTDPNSDTPYANIPTSQWVHIVVTFSRLTESISVFIDGRLANSSTLREPLQHTGDLFIGGATVHPMDGGFNGLIDELMIYDRALTTAEIKALYTWGADTLVPDIAWWQMYNRYTRNIDDATGQGHTASIVGVPTFGYAPEIGQCYVQFDGNSWLQAADAEDLDLLDDWTITFWTRPGPLFNGVEFVLDKGCPGVMGGYSLAVGDSFQLTANPGGVGGETHLRADPLAVGTWYHVAMSHLASTAVTSITVNGVVVTNGIVGPLTGSNNYLLLGACKDYGCVVNPGYRSRGALADVRIYGRPLSAEIIKRLYEQAAGPFITLLPTVIWETTGTDGYLLEGSANPAGPWTLVTSTQHTLGSRAFVFPEPFGTLQFFRLRKP